MEQRVEQLEEKWFKFIRIYCKEGYIDRWMGDSINNPNNITKSRMSLNQSVSFYRLNDEDWISDRELGRGRILELLQYSTEFSAKEIFEESKK